MSIILLVGASGSGKTTLGKKLEANGIKQLVSFTTRQAREGEIEGMDYYFVDKSNVEHFDLAEISHYGGNHYGLFKREVKIGLEMNEHVYFITDTNGAKQMVEMYPDDTEYFWIDTTLETMVKRMRNRGDNEEQILKRIEHAIDNNETQMPDNIDANIFTLDSENTVEDNVFLIKAHLYLKSARVRKIIKILGEVA